MNETQPQIDDGGPAFPTDSEHLPQAHVLHYEGMSTRMWLAGRDAVVWLGDVRDYFGWSKDIPLAKQSRWLPETTSSVESAEEKWSALTIEERHKAIAAIRFKLADAMLKAAREDSHE